MTTKYPVANLLEPVLLLAFLLVLNSCNTNTPLSENSQHKSGTVNEPVDVKVEFPSIKIGNQIWMTENLSVDTFRNGDPIRYAEGYKIAWDDVQYIYDNDPRNLRNHGRLYSLGAVMDRRGLAPEGWHIPSKKEWEELIDFLGGSDSAAYRLMVDWDYLPTRNQSGFNATPSGYYGGPLDISDGIGYLFYYFHRVQKGFGFEKLPLISWNIFSNKIVMSSDYNGGRDWMFPVRCIKNDSAEMSHRYLFCDSLELIDAPIEEEVIVEDVEDPFTIENNSIFGQKE